MECETRDDPITGGTIYPKTFSLKHIYLKYKSKHGLISNGRINLKNNKFR